MFKKSRLAFIALSISLVSLSGCVTNPSKQDIGTVLGAVVGGVVGNQFGGGTGNTIFTIAGVIAGAYVGSTVGKSMDEHDRNNAASSLERGLNQPEYGSSNSWWRQGKGNRHYESYVNTSPVPRTYQGNCKSYTQDVVVYIDGRREVATTRGIACRNLRTGEWQLQPN